MWQNPSRGISEQLRDGTSLTMSAHALEAATAVNGYLLHPKFPEFGYNLFERDAI